MSNPHLGVRPHRASRGGSDGREKVYPGIVKAAPGEKPDVHHGKKEHEQAEKILHRLERTSPGDGRFDTVLAEPVDAVSHHVEEEDTEILSTLEKAVGAAELERLGRAFARRRQQELAAQCKETRASGAPSGARPAT